MFGNKFLGVYPSDQLINMKNNEMLIANLDKSGEPGSHWISIGRSNGTTYVYDSFGRNVIPSILKEKYGTIVMTEKDAEQKMKESNCGARSLAWLYVFNLCGPEIAILI